MIKHSGLNYLMLGSVNRLSGMIQHSKLNFLMGLMHPFTLPCKSMGISLFLGMQIPTNILIQLIFTKKLLSF